MAKTAFFDMDGTIIAPIFYKDGKLRTALPVEQWIDYCNEQKDHALDHCVPVDSVVQLAIQLRRAGWDCKILTIVRSEIEKSAKKIYLKNMRLDKTFREIIFVKDDDDKMRYLQDHVAANDPRDTILVEDSLYNAMAASHMGVIAVHTSHVAAYLGPQIIEKLLEVKS